MYCKSSNPQTKTHCNEDDYCDEDEFIPCSGCDGHPACEDFGCAIEHGLGHLVNKEPGADGVW